MMYYKKIGFLIITIAITNTIFGPPLATSLPLSPKNRSAYNLRKRIRITNKRRKAISMHKRKKAMLLICFFMLFPLTGIVFIIYLSSNKKPDIIQSENNTTNPLSGTSTYNKPSKHKKNTSVKFPNKKNNTTKPIIPKAYYDKELKYDTKKFKKMLRKIFNETQINNPNQPCKKNKDKKRPLSFEEFYHIISEDINATFSIFFSSLCIPDKKNLLEWSLDFYFDKKNPLTAMLMNHPHLNLGNHKKEYDPGILHRAIQKNHYTATKKLLESIKYKIDKRAISVINDLIENIIKAGGNIRDGAVKRFYLLIKKHNKTNIKFSSNFIEHFIKYSIKEQQDDKLNQEVEKKLDMSFNGSKWWRTVDSKEYRLDELFKKEKEIKEEQLQYYILSSKSIFSNNTPEEKNTMDNYLEKSEFQKFLLDEISSQASQLKEEQTIAFLDWFFEVE